MYESGGINIYLYGVWGGAVFGFVGMGYYNKILKRRIYVIIKMGDVLLLIIIKCCYY